jgi:prevent-host-death family protein
VTTIPQRELRNNVSDILRRAEQGEHFTVTVDGRPVAELGPLGDARPRGQAHQLAEIFANAPVDPGWADDLRLMRAEEDAVDASSSGAIEE